MTSASKFNTEPNGGIFDVSLENDLASPNVRTVSLVVVSAPQSVMRMYMSGVDLDATSAELTEKIFANIDKNKDGKLSMQVPVRVGPPRSGAAGRVVGGAVGGEVG